MLRDSPRKKIGRGFERTFDAGVLQPLARSLGLHLKAERKWSKTIHTYVEAAQWVAAEYLIRPAVHRPAAFTLGIHMRLMLGAAGRVRAGADRVRRRRDGGVVLVPV